MIHRPPCPLPIATEFFFPLKKERWKTFGKTWGALNLTASKKGLSREDRPKQGIQKETAEGFSRADRRPEEQ